MTKPKLIEDIKDKIVEITDTNDDILYSNYEEYFKSINLPILEFRIINSRYYCSQYLIGLEIITLHENIKYSIQVTKKL